MSHKRSRETRSKHAKPARATTVRSRAGFGCTFLPAMNKGASIACVHICPCLTQTLAGDARAIVCTRLHLLLDEDGVPVPNAQLPEATSMGCHWRRPRGARRPAKLRRQELFAIYLADTKCLPKRVQPDLVYVHWRLHIEAKVANECGEVLQPSVMTTRRVRVSPNVRAF